ncbi:SWIB-domain-containing protein [Hesseltinella vesiculosa]|uniref:SWIB-domain-containing protein n=1 Tax=Hesseltinella vesiculosa TaxID=101127 RepID=A0A1X2GBB1_9FUNG|nr:SWIB-domain-containing protein [Hesseltinella vesiculosa]
MDVQQFKPQILEILRVADLDTITSKNVRSQLQERTDEPLGDYKKPLNALIMQCLDEINPPVPTSEKTPSPPKSSAPASKRKTEADENDKSRKKPAKKRVVDKSTLEKNPFTKTWKLSDTLASIVGESELSRPGVVKMIWKYIKENDLQDPNKKTDVLCDDKLRTLFEGAERMNCFTMNKYISKHLSSLPTE